MSANGASLRGVDVAIFSKLRPVVVEVTVVDERIMRLRLKHHLGFISLVAVNAPTEVCEMEEMFYTKPKSTLCQCPSCIEKKQHRVRGRPHGFTVA